MVMHAVSTRGYDNARSNCTYNETILTEENVSKRGIVRLYSIPLLGDARGTEGQPLIAPGIRTVDGFTHDLLITATMGNMLYAFDANAATPQMVWAQRLGNPVAGSRTIDEFVINPNWGVLSTPVIDQEEQLIYSVAFSSVDGSYQKGEFFLHVNRLYDGAPVKPALSLETAVDSSGNKFSGVQRKQRAALLLTNVGGVKTLFIAAGSIFESLDSNLGWLIAVDVSTFAIRSAWTSCPTNGGGGIWMAGQGPAADEAGNVYLVTGNGSFDGTKDFGECACRLAYDSKTGKISLVDWFSPFMDDMRDGKIVPPGKPTNANGWDDQDLGSSGVVLLEKWKRAVNSGKDGIAYVTKMDSMGKTSVADLKAGDQFAALAAPPEWFTYFPGYDVPPNPADPTKLNFNWGGVTHHMHGSPAYYETADGTSLIYCWGENGNLRAWEMTDGGLVYVASGRETASQDDPGMPGGMVTVSANKSDRNSGVVWACVPYRDANKEISPGRLIAYSAVDVVDGSMRKLWDSQDWNIRFTHNKFNCATVSGGRVFVPTYSDTIDVYALTPM